MRQTHSFSHTLRFTFSAGTSRGVMTTRPTHYLVLEQNGRRGVGECAPLAGLSEDDVPNLPMMIDLVRQRLEKRPVPRSAQEAFQWVQDAVPANLPSVRFGAETALLDLLHGGRRLLFPSVMHPDFTPVPINGLVWMGDPAFMQQQIDDKLEQGFRCIKLKIGAIDFSKELRLLQGIRKRYSRDMVSLRVDANGAFSPAKAMDKLKRLAKLDVHSIEQPIAPGQPEAMAALCRNSPVPIALDEELIGVHTSKERAQLLDTIQPQYIILKPTLLGGLAAADDWVMLAENRGIGWWVTSALESNVGLNAIAQWVSLYEPTVPQGLGTGQLYHNNVDAPLYIDRGYLHYDPAGAWDESFFNPR
ncbi:MAG: o-succinylbenzoate synthase [Tunicatimonas sp.]